MDNQLSFEQFSNLPTNALEELSAGELFNQISATGKLTEADLNSPYNDIGEQGQETGEQAWNNAPDMPIPEVNPDGNINVGKVISAQIALSFIDNLLPLAMVWLIQSYAGKKISKKSLQLTVPEKKEIEPILQQCLETISVDIKNPWIALAVVMGGIYGSKAMELIMNEPEKPQGQANNTSKGRGRPRKVNV